MRRPSLDLIHGGPVSTAVSEASAGIVLLGGGACGAYEVGVLRALIDGESPSTNFEPLHLSVLSGTSAGAFNAAHLLSHPGGDMSAAIGELEQTWVEEIAGEPGNWAGNVLRYRMDPLEFIRPGFSAFLSSVANAVGDSYFLAGEWLKRGASFLRSPASLQLRALGATDLSAFICMKPFERLVRRKICLDRIRESTRRLLLQATNWRTGCARRFENEDMVDTVGHSLVLASAAVPCLFRPVEIDGETYVDGSVSSELPLRSAIDKGAKTLHVIFADAELQNLPFADVRNTADDLYRLTLVGLVNALRRDLSALRSTRLAPDWEEPTSDKGLQNVTVHRYFSHGFMGGPIRWLDFERDSISRSIRQGFSDAVHHDCALNQCVSTGLAPGARFHGA